MSPGTLHPVGFWNSGEADVVTVTGDSFSAFNFGANAVATMIWNTDGTRDEKANTSSAVQVFSSTDWIIPNGSASSSYRGRHTSASGDTGSWVPAGTINTWLAFNAPLDYVITDTTAIGGDAKSVTFNFEIDDGGGTALDSASQTITADREDF